MSVDSDRDCCLHHEKCSKCRRRCPRCHFECDLECRECPVCHHCFDNSIAASAVSVVANMTIAGRFMGVLRDALLEFNNLGIYYPD
jgi:hypothetical protein